MKKRIIGIVSILLLCVSITGAQTFSSTSVMLRENNVPAATRTQQYYMNSSSHRTTVISPVGAREVPSLYKTTFQKSVSGPMRAPGEDPDLDPENTDIIQPIGDALWFLLLLCGLFGYWKYAEFKIEEK